jgi:hypothetical protein
MLPEAKRAPRAAKCLGDERPIQRALEPPKGALVVRTYTRQLEREEDGTLRYTRPEDYPLPESPGTRSGSPRREAARFREAGHDFLWIPEKEWRAMIPDEPKVGFRVPVPATFKVRLLRYHLDPERGLGEAQWFTRARPEDGKLELVVEEASAERVRMRLEGYAKLARESHKGLPTTYDPSLLGYLTYDVQDKEISELKMIALGDVLNTPRGVRPGLRPLGIAFELVRDPSPGERVVPRGGRDNVKRYLEIDSR